MDVHEFASRVVCPSVRIDSHRLFLKKGRWIFTGLAGPSRAFTRRRLLQGRASLKHFNILAESFFAFVDDQEIHTEVFLQQSSAIFSNLQQSSAIFSNLQHVHV